MLAHGLAVLLGFSSVVFYIAAFFYPEVHRRADILWSGLGVCYAVELWFSAQQITGLVLLTQITAVVLLLGLGWQTLSVRREKTPVYQQTPVVLTPEVVGNWTKNKLNQLRIAPDDKVRSLPPQNRSLTASAADRFRQEIDPRRRPIYDYEFVEDGVSDEVIETATVEGIVAPEQSDSNQGLAAALVPPSAEAVILEEVTPEKTQSETAKTGEPLGKEDQSGQDKPRQVAANAFNGDKQEDVSAAEDIAIAPGNTAEAAPLAVESTSNEPRVTSEAPSESAVSEFTTSELTTSESIELEPTVSQHNDPEPTGPEPTVADATFSASTAPEPNETADDWGVLDDWATDIPSEEITTADTSEASKTPQQPTKSSSPSQKPSALAMPVILLGWVKDVVTSMTKPKPSKPVINIPRREPQTSSTIASAPFESTAQAPSQPTPTPPNRADTSRDDTHQTDVNSSNADSFEPDSLDTNELDNANNFDDDNSWEESNWDD